MKPKISKVVLEWSKSDEVEDEVGQDIYKVDVQTDPGYGVPSAILVSNRYDEEFFLQSASAEAIAYFACKSWI